MSESQKSELLRDLRDTLDYHRSAFERQQRYFRLEYGKGSAFDIRVELDMHERFMVAIGKAIELLE